MKTKKEIIDEIYSILKEYKEAEENLTKMELELSEKEITQISQLADAESLTFSEYVCKSLENLLNEETFEFCDICGTALPNHLIWCARYES